MADNDRAAVGTVSDPLYRSSDRSGVKVPHMLADGYAAVLITRVVLTGTTPIALPATPLPNRCRIDVLNVGAVECEIVSSSGAAFGDGWPLDQQVGEKSFPLAAGGLIYAVIASGSGEVVVIEYAPY